VFFDGNCPLCMREIRFLRSRDRQGRIRFTDIAGPDFDPAETGRELHELMARIHGRLPDGTLVEGVEVFRRLYEAVGFETLVRFSRFPVVSALAELAYGVFAKNRLRITGRCADDACRAPGAEREVEKADGRVPIDLASAPSQLEATNGTVVGCLR